MKTLPVIVSLPLLCLWSCGHGIGNKTRHEELAKPYILNEVESEIVTRINNLRDSAGVTPVTIHAGLSGIARQHSRYMSLHSGDFNFISSSITHFNLEGRSKKSAMRYNISELAENVAMTRARKRVANAIVKGWIDSPAHRGVIMEREYKVVGVGVVKVGNATFGTLLLGVPDVGVLPPFVGPNQ